MRIETLLAETSRLLIESGISNGSQEARWLLSQLLQEQPIQAQPCSSGTELPPPLEQLFRQRVQRRVNGEPLQYIMGTAEFHCVELDVGPGVLIPRPETEQLVEIALDLYPGHGPVCDLCTGSGAIALALAKQLPKTQFTGTDISLEALTWAERNKAKLALPNASFLHGDLFSPIAPETQFSLITANPPYVSQGDYDTLEPVVKDYEPKLALVAENGGMAVLERIAEQARHFMLPSAWIICEIGEEQGKGASDTFAGKGYANIRIKKDYAGKDRFVLAQALT